MALVEGDDMVQEIAPTTFDPTLCNPILPRTPERGSDRRWSSTALSLEPPNHIWRRDQKSETWESIRTEGFTQLLNDPHCS